MPKTTAKTFDCVEMKRQGSQALRQKLRGKPKEAERAFWHERTEALRQRTERRTAACK